MIKSIQSFLEAYIEKREQGNAGPADGHAMRLATAALFMEIARADFAISEQERDRVLILLRDQFDLDEGRARELAELGEQQAHEHSSLYPFTRMINDAFSFEEKRTVVENLWRVAYADKDLHKYEEYLVRKISDLLHMPHSQMMRAKHRVLDELEK